MKVSFQSSIVNALQLYDELNFESNISNLVPLKLQQLKKTQ